MEICETIRTVAGAARNLKLLPETTLDRLFSITIEAMSRRDIENLVEVARQLELALIEEARKRI